MHSPHPQVLNTLPILPYSCHLSPVRNSTVSAGTDLATSATQPLLITPSWGGLRTLKLHRIAAVHTTVGLCLCVLCKHRQQLSGNQWPHTEHLLALSSVCKWIINKLYPSAHAKSPAGKKAPGNSLTCMCFVYFLCTNFVSFAFWQAVFHSVSKFQAIDITTIFTTGTEW